MLKRIKNFEICYKIDLLNKKLNTLLADPLSPANLFAPTVCLFPLVFISKNLFLVVHCSQCWTSHNGFIGNCCDKHEKFR